MSKMKVSGTITFFMLVSLNSLFTFPCRDEKTTWATWESQIGDLRFPNWRLEIHELATQAYSFNYSFLMWVVNLVLVIVLFFKLVLGGSIVAGLINSRNLYTWRNNAMSGHVDTALSSNSDCRLIESRPCRIHMERFDLLGCFASVENESKTCTMFSLVKRML